MNRRQKLTAVMSVAVVSLAITCVTASPWTANTPLYTFRMEQASNKMNFLPTAVNGFIYSTEKGYALNYDAAGYCGATPYGTYDTCGECTTIEITCWSCWYTCLNTCPNTCENTCVSTCGTCAQTCPSTCKNTCPNTCWNTCPNTCWATCWNTCENTCEGPECTTIEITCWTCYSC